jgi:methyltransferase (TIGR00027 family)
MNERPPASNAPDTSSVITKIDPICATAFFIASLKFLSSKDYRVLTGANTRANRKDIYKDHRMSFFGNNQQILEKAKSLFLDMDEAIKVFGIRHKYMLGKVKQCIRNQDIKQIVILGAGFDTTGERKKKQLKDANIKFYEVDKKEVLDLKKRILLSSEPTEEINSAHVPCDYLKEDFIRCLTEKGLDLSLPTYFIWEGNTMYLDKPQILSVLKTIQANFKSFVITIDCISRTAIEGNASIPEATKIINQFKTLGAPFKSGFNPDDVEILSREANLEVKEITHLGKLAKEYAEKYSQITEAQAQHDIYNHSVVFTLKNK